MLKNSKSRVYFVKPRDREPVREGSRPCQHTPNPPRSHAGLQADRSKASGQKRLSKSPVTGRENRISPPDPKKFNSSTGPEAASGRSRYWIPNSMPDKPPSGTPVGSKAHTSLMLSTSELAPVAMNGVSS